MKLLYNNYGRNADLDKLSLEFDDVYKIRDFDSSVPYDGFFIGSIEGCRWIKANRPNVVVFSSFEKYTCQNYYPIISDFLFNKTYAFIPFHEIPRLKWDLWRWLGRDTELFIRPDCGEKPFPACVVDIENIDNFVERYEESYCGMAVIARPKQIAGEWRFIVADKKIHSVSSYKYAGLTTFVASAPSTTTTFVNKVLEEVEIQPDPIFCIDVAVDEQMQPGVIEITPFSSAGLYANNSKIVANLITEKYDDIMRNRNIELDECKKCDK
jgi:hypothetical protein